MHQKVGLQSPVEYFDGLFKVVLLYDCCSVRHGCLFKCVWWTGRVRKLCLWQPVMDWSDVLAYVVTMVEQCVLGNVGMINYSRGR